MLKQTNKVFSLFLIFSLVFPTLISGLMATTKVAYAIELGKSEMVDTVKLEKTDLYSGDRIGISVTFSEKAGQNIKNGDTITMSLPPELLGIVSSAELKDPETGRVFGEVKIVKDQVICTFNQTAEDLNNIKGHFFFNVRVDSQMEGTISKTTDFGLDIEALNYTVTYEKGETGGIDEGNLPFMTKYGNMSEDGSNLVTWQILVNQPKKELEQSTGNVITLEDTSSMDQTLLPDSFRYYEQDRGNNFKWIAPEEFQKYGTLEIDPINQNHFIIKLNSKEISMKKFGVVYDTKINDLGKSQFTNDYKMNYQVAGGEIVNENGTAITKNIGAGAGGTGDLPEKGSVRIVKSLENNVTTLLPGITFQLFNSQSQPLGDFQTDDKGQINVKDLALGGYYFKETKAPNQFQFDEAKLYPFEITESSTTGVLINVSNGLKKTSLNLKKVWIGPENDQIDVKIFADGRDINQQVTLSKANNWELQVADLDQYNLDGSVINYTVSEVNVPEGFESSVTGDLANGFTITNKNIETVSIPVTKKWIGNPLESVDVYLKINDKVTSDMIKLSAGNNWQGSFEKLEKYDKTGNKNVYSIVEADVVGFAALYEGDVETGFTITNIRTESVEIPVEKKWVGPIGKPVTLELLIDGKESGRSVELNNENNWKSLFTNLPKYDQTGRNVEYTISEKFQQEHYDSKITGDPLNGFTVTNTNNEKIAIPVTKNWIGPIGEKATIHLYQDGKNTAKSLTLTNQENWQGTFSELEKYAEDGHEIVYTIKEDSVENYSSLVKGDMKDGFTVTNTSTEKIQIPITKKWNGEKQKSVKIYVKSNGELLLNNFVELSESNNWQDSFRDLPKYSSDGQAINYTVVEEQLDGYATTYEGTQSAGYTVTNTRTDSISIPVIKKWVGPIGDEVRINLLANNQETGRQAILKADQGWQVNFTNLAKYDESGQPIHYTINEVATENYDSTITGEAENGFIVTNTNNEEVTIPVTKKWNGPVKDSVKIILYDNQNSKLNELTLNEDSNWQGQFEHLPKYDKGGALINYSIREEALENYNVRITGSVEEGYTVINTNTEKISIDVIKKWVGPVAGRVQINLLKDGAIVNTFINLDASNQWQSTFDNLAKYNQDGSEIKYSIVETVGYKNYDEKIEESVKNKFIVTNVNTEKITIPVNKKWVGPIGNSVTIQLEQNGKNVKELELNQANNWKNSFNDMPKYDEKGNEYLYTVKEVAMENYDATISGDSQNGFTIINSNNEMIEIPVNKKWVGPIGNSVTIQLEQNGKNVKELELNQANNWKNSFNDMPKYDEKGNEYLYTVKEVAMENYDATISGDSQNGFTIINSNNEMIEIPVNKKWNGPKANKVVIHLEQNGVKFDSSLILTEDMNWQGRFENLPKYDEEGQLYNYSIKEEPLVGYQEEITGNSQTGFIVTNTFIQHKENEKDLKSKMPVSQKITDTLLPNLDKASKETLKATDKAELPQTGEAQSNWMMIIGASLICIVAMISLPRAKKKN